MKQYRRGLMGTITAGLASGLAGCSHRVFTGTPTPQPRAKVYVAKDTLTIEPRGATLYGQIDAKGLTAKSVPEPNSVDTATGSLNVSGAETVTVNFDSDSLTAISVIAETGRFDILSRGRIIRRGEKEYSGTLDGKTVTRQAKPTKNSRSRGTETTPSARVFASQESILFDFEGGMVSGQVGAQNIEGLNLEPDDELDPSTGRFVFSGENQDRITFDSGSLSAVSIISQKQRFDVFYRGELIARKTDQFSRSFAENTAQVEHLNKSTLDLDELVILEETNEPGREPLVVIAGDLMLTGNGEDYPEAPSGERSGGSTVTTPCPGITKASAVTGITSSSANTYVQIKGLTAVIIAPNLTTEPKPDILRQQGVKVIQTTDVSLEAKKMVSRLCNG